MVAGEVSFTKAIEYAGMSFNNSDKPLLVTAAGKKALTVLYCLLGLNGRKPIALDDFLQQINKRKKFSLGLANRPKSICTVGSSWAREQR